MAQWEDRIVFERRERGDLEAVCSVYSSVGFEFIGFRRTYIGGDVSFVEKTMAEPPFELCDALFKFWWTPARSSRRGVYGACRHLDEDCAEERRMETEVSMSFARISGGNFAAALSGGVDADFF